MTTRMTRKEFCGSLLGATVLLLVQGCGGGSGYSSDPTAAGSPPPAGGGGGGTPSTGCTPAISANHGHVLTIPLADLDSATDKTYDIQGTALHTHSVTLTAAELRTLKTGAAVTTVSSTGGSHTHDITITCM